MTVFFQKKALKMVLLVSTRVKTFLKNGAVFSARMSLFNAHSESLIVTKYERNDSFFQKKALKMVLLLSTRVKTNVFVEWSSFF